MLRQNTRIKCWNCSVKAGRDLCLHLQKFSVNLHTMANPEHLAKLNQGVEAWNRWRAENPSVTPDLQKAQIDIADLKGINFKGAGLRWAWFKTADMTGANLQDADFGYAHVAYSKMDGANLTGAYFREAACMSLSLRGANCHHAIFSGASLIDADLSDAMLEAARISDRAIVTQAKLHNAHLAGADLTTSDFRGAEFIKADLKGANLNQAFLVSADFTDADLTSAQLFRTDLADAKLVRTNLTDADLGFARLIDTDLQDAKLVNCSIHGISAWGVNLEGATQSNLVITSSEEWSRVTVDHLDVAQFVYLLLTNSKLRDVINTVANKAVLILGRFTERKALLDAISGKLKDMGYVPIIFDFEKPLDRDFTETIKVLAGMSLFIIADITNPKSAPLELQATVPDYQVPFVPIIQQGQVPFSMFDDLPRKYSWVLDVLEYGSQEALLSTFEEKVVNRALAKHDELRELKALPAKRLSA